MLLLLQARGRSHNGCGWKAAPKYPRKLIGPQRATVLAARISRLLRSTTLPPLQDTVLSHLAPKNLAGVFWIVPDTGT